jgi:hypothetical protein
MALKSVSKLARRIEVRERVVVGERVVDISELNYNFE